ncbi:hypothetical protein R1sor_023967 [Riccia sorocarpa]|uniref:Uncharacterized protein n=1 Tax=Riccia sorocarpa TaxID=122646 RepID=A0ABD3GT75_9MARC
MVGLEVSSYEVFKTQKDINESKAKLTELRAFLTTLTRERNSVLELSQRLQQELVGSLSLLLFSFFETNMVATLQKKKRNAWKGSSQASKSQQTHGFFFLSSLWVSLAS